MSAEWLQEVVSNAKRRKQRLQCQDVRKPEKGAYGNAYSLDKQSDGVCRIQYPYGVIYRMSDRKYIEIAGKAISNDRRRIHYRITDLGREYLEKITGEYESFLAGMNMIMRYVEQLSEADEKKD